MNLTENKNRLLLIIIILVVLQCIAFVIVFIQLRSINNKVEAINRLMIEKLINNENEGVNIEIRPDDIVFGSEKAPLTVFMFSNYTCSICNSFFIETFPDIESKLINTGKIRFVIKLIPSRRAKGSVLKAKYLICATRQNRFTELHNYLISPETESDSAQIADYMSKSLKMDMQQLDKCLSDKGLNNYLMENIKTFRNYKIKGTPAFIINGNIYLGNKSFEKFEEIVNEELKGQKKQFK